MKKHYIILGYLRRYGSIDRYVAMTQFEVWDLPQQISKIRRMDISIITRGKGKHLKYTIREVADKYKAKQDKAIQTTITITP